MPVKRTIESQHQARLALVNCAWYRRERDNLIRSAAQLGIGPTEIARILGMNRSHISEIANRDTTG